MGELALLTAFVSSGFAAVVYVVEAWRIQPAMGRSHAAGSDFRDDSAKSFESITFRIIHDAAEPQMTNINSGRRLAKVFQNASNAARKPERRVASQGNSSKNNTFFRVGSFESRL